MQPNTSRKNLVKGMIFAALALQGAQALAADLPSVKEPFVPAALDAGDTPWFVRLGVAGLLFDSSATIALGGATYPGASAKAGNNVTALFEVGYFATKNISVQFTGGYPPTATLTGAGSLAGFGALGKATYGPAAVTVSWHFKELGAFQPYVGVGAAYAIIFGTSDGVVKNLSIPGAGAFVVQGGADYYLNRNWSLFVDAKYILLGVNATGNALGQPVVAHVNLDPTVISGGVSYHW